MVHAVETEKKTKIGYITYIRTAKSQGEKQRMETREEAGERVHNSYLGPPNLAPKTAPFFFRQWFVVDVSNRGKRQNKIQKLVNLPKKQRVLKGFKAKKGDDGD